MNEHININVKKNGIDHIDPQLTPTSQLLVRPKSYITIAQSSPVEHLNRRMNAL